MTAVQAPSPPSETRSSEQGEDRRRKAAVPSKACLVIRTKLQVERRMRYLALLNVAIDSKLRGRDIVALKVDDLATGAADRATVRQKKIGRPVKFAVTTARKRTALKIAKPSLTRVKLSGEA